MCYSDYCAGAKHLPASWQALPDNAGLLAVSDKVITLLHYVNALVISWLRMLQIEKKER
jgi:hypothetical protein